MRAAARARSSFTEGPMRHKAEKRAKHMSIRKVALQPKRSLIQPITRPCTTAPRDPIPSSRAVTVAAALLLPFKWGCRPRSVDITEVIKL
mmetsp:Transcript_118330/g.307349  ORF Transcript_118330/g.307349 Transcript_118330/m.307349 type:complete len:90 (-) Transcript_118330:1238-1507(-)